MSELRVMLDELMIAFHDIQRQIQVADPHEYERWKAGGFIIDDNIMSMYPNITEVVEKLACDDKNADPPLITPMNGGLSMYTCPVCGEKVGPSGVGGGSWVHIR